MTFSASGPRLHQKSIERGQPSRAMATHRGGVGQAVWPIGQSQTSARPSGSWMLLDESSTAPRIMLVEPGASGSSVGGFDDLPRSQ